jgi:cytochrome b subunit of formate dehydrogenase
MSMIWPTRTNNSPDGFVRLGRVLHWLGAIVGVLLMIAGAAFLLNPALGAERWIGFAFVVPGLLIFFVARGVRYTLSAE